MKLRSTFAVILAALMLSESAFALSCMRPDLVKTLEEAKASDKIYHILVGRFVTETVPDHGQMPNDKGVRSMHENGTWGLPKNKRTPIITQSWFEGIGLTKDKRSDGQLTRFPVDIETRCLASWCSSPPSSERDVIAFVEAREEQAPLLKISPCPQWVFSGELPAKVAKIRQCLDKTCAPNPNPY